MRGHVIEEGLPPADPVEIAAAFTALGRGMALMSKAGETSRAGKIIVIFLKALIRIRIPSLA